MHVHVGAKGDQPYLSVVRKGLEGLGQGCSAGRKLVLCHAGVDDKYVCRRGDDLWRGRLVLNGLILLEQLCRLVLHIRGTRM